LPEPFLHNPIGTPFIELLSIDSTNNYALTQLHAGLTQHGAAFFAHEQVAGKGQRGKTWTSERDANLILSVVIDPTALDLTQQFQLSACIAVSVTEFFSRYVGEATRIKWPNDLYWYDRKAGGILIENIVGSQKGASWSWAVAGVGININQVSFPGEVKNPVSLRQITGKVFDPILLAKELCLVMDKNFKQLITKGFEDIYGAYLAMLYKRNEPVKLKKDNRVFEAIIRSVLPTGELVVQYAIEESFQFGEIEWVITADPNEK
jgi:BirA family transcriptional regulator, biotin operon repressor / biotin---[acetyl-CoA-carboxylase] ligase